MSNPFPLSIDTPLVRAALDIATKAHEDQTRDDKQTPYITHPVAVANRAVYLHARALLSESYIAATRTRELITVLALFHDIAEEGDKYSEHEIVRPLREAKLIEEDEYQSLASDMARLNRVHSSSYLNHTLMAKERAATRFVKRADLWHNQLGDIPASRREKYLLALHILESI